MTGVGVNVTDELEAASLADEEGPPLGHRLVRALPRGHGTARYNDAGITASRAHRPHQPRGMAVGMAGGSSCKLCCQCELWQTMRICYPFDTITALTQGPCTQNMQRIQQFLTRAIAAATLI